MGSKCNWIIIWIMLCALPPCPNVRASENYTSTRGSLNSFLYDYALNQTPRIRTGKLYDVSVPQNLSGVQISVIRLRTRSLWINGVNVSYFRIPPRVLPRPFARRVDIVYQNLGNMSSFYYSVPNYTFVAPVIGLLAYDPNTRSTKYTPVELKIMGNDPIVVRFPNISVHENVTKKCVRFGVNGTLEFSSVANTSSCVARGPGHFSVVIPYQPVHEESKRRFRWWIVVVAAAVGLVLMGILAYKLFRGSKMRNMERQSERSENVDTVWIGNSKMPTASGIRTQPVLENSYVP